MSGHDLAAAIASATGGTVHALPTDARWPSFGVEIAPAGCVVLVRDHGNIVTASIGKRAWHVPRGEGVPADLPGEARGWAERHAQDATLTDAALALAPALDRAFQDHWELSIPGGQPAPTEMWLAPSDGSARASVGVFEASIRVSPAVVTMPKRRDLAGACAEVVRHVESQLAAYERNVVLSKECARIAAELAARLGKCSATTGTRFPTHFAAVVSAVVEGQRELARVEARDGSIFVDAGLPEARGWHGTAERALADVDAIARAIDAMTGVVTYDTLEYGASYRVLCAFKGLREGEIVAYGGPIDNHAPHEFKRESGEVVLVEEWDLRREVDRVLARV